MRLHDFHTLDDHAWKKKEAHDHGKEKKRMHACF